MGFLRRLLQYRRICIQCHNSPDADSVASAFGLYRYLTGQGVEAFIVYGGALPIKKSNMKTMIRECGIPIAHERSPRNYDLLLMVDCQYGLGNAERFPAERVAIIDHHVPSVEPGEDVLILWRYQSCSTIIYELLLEEGYPVKEDEQLAVALLYGLYTDTSSFSDLFGANDTRMRTELFAQQPLFERLTKSNLTVAELLIASDAMLNHYLDVEGQFAIVEALKCDATVLGIIGDFIIQVDAVNLSLCYTETDVGYQISLRSCHESLRANEIAAYICRDIGSGGGHSKKAGGQISLTRMREKYGQVRVFDVVNRLICQYLEEKGE